MNLKILFISHNFSPFIGGIEVISQILAGAFTRDGHEVHLLTWSKDKSGKAYPYKVIRNPGTLTLLKEHKWADMVFENNPCLRLSWPAIFFRKPSVVTLQTWVSRVDGSISFKDRLKLKWLKRADQVISCSKAIQKGCFPESIVIHNPYQEDLFKVIPSIKRDKDFVFLGRMVSDKGADLAIKAFQKIANNHQESGELKLTMVGDGPEKRKLKDLVSRLNLNDKVTFTGSLVGEKLVKCLNQHKYLLVPSIWEEPFGIVALEGMACGCLPITSNGGGLPEATGEAGLIFNKGELESLVKCIQKVINRAELKGELLSKAESHLSEHNSSGVARKYLDVIKMTYRKKKLSTVQQISV